MPLRLIEVRRWAALGARRGEGESLASWLAAGPLGSHAFDAAGIPRPVSPFAFCPACRLVEGVQKRLYSRRRWRKAPSVACAVHGIPLVYGDAPPLRLRVSIDQAMRARLRVLAHWTTTWRVGLGGTGAGVESDLLWAITRRTDPRAPFSEAWATGQWRCWADDWPVRPSPRQPARFSWDAVTQPGDRLALVATIFRLVHEDSEQANAWSPLPVRPRVWATLLARWRRTGLVDSARPEQWLRPASTAS